MGDQLNPVSAQPRPRPVPPSRACAEATPCCPPIGSARSAWSHFRLARGPGHAPVLRPGRLCEFGGLLRLITRLKKGTPAGLALSLPRPSPAR
jgi:hypothetical protein